MKTWAPYDVATSGSSAEAAAWTQALMDGLAKAEDDEVATALLDLSAASDRIHFATLIRAALALGFPRVLLAMALRIFGLERRIVIDGVWSEGNGGSRGILPGSVSATDCMRAVMLPVFARLQAA